MAPGAVCTFLYDTVCGIRLDGERHFIIMPQPGGTLNYAAARWLSPFGEIRSAWEKKEKGIQYNIVIPDNTTAQLILPGQETKNLHEGTYTFLV